MRHLNKTIRPLLATIIVIFSSVTQIDAEVLIPAGSSLINYYGRFDFSTPGSAKFNWSGSTIEAAFVGRSIGIELSDGQADYDIEIDGAFHSTIQTQAGISYYNVSDQLSDAAHAIRLIQRSENHWSAATFRGFYVADGKKLLAPPQKPARKIEFIGDSYTVGYGNESAARSCSSAQLRQYTNTNKSFGKLVTDAFHAQSIVLGWSGQGMVRNYGDAAKKSQTPYPYYYKNTLGAVGGVWDFSQWVPDLVVICLGTNDFSTTPYPDDTMYRNAYHAFIDTIKGYYPDASILCVSTPTGPVVTHVKKIVADEVAVFNHNKTYYAEFPSNLAFSGCDWHPSVADDKAIAGNLIKAIMAGVGWDTTTNSNLVSAVRRRQELRRLCVFPVNDGILVSVSPGAGQEELAITDLKGRFVGTVAVTGSRPSVWNTTSCRPGTYLISSRAQGLYRAVVVNTQAGVQR